MKDIYSNRGLDSSDPLKANNTKNILDTFRYIKGRRYHNLIDVAYLLPNDHIEANRLNLQHNIFKFVWQNNFSSPVYELLKSGKAKVLDIGCGTGQWSLDMAKDYPQATHVGVDMSPIFPDTKNTPSNAIFLQLNLNDGLPFPDETFDFVFQRFLCNCVTFKQWKFYVKEMIRVTKPGGWLEFFEFNIDYRDAGPYFKKIMKLVHSEFKAKGINEQPETCVPRFLANCKELSEVHYEEASIPMGNWTGQLDVTMNTYMSMNFDTIRLILTSAWGINDEAFDSINDKLKHEFGESEEFKVYIKSFRWYSKKILKKKNIFRIIFNFFSTFYDFLIRIYLNFL